MKTFITATVILALCGPSIANAQQTISQQEIWQRVARSMKQADQVRRDAATTTYASRTQITGPYGTSTIRTETSIGPK
jgi:hypothetical protein